MPADDVGRADLRILINSLRQPKLQLAPKIMKTENASNSAPLNPTSRQKIENILVPIDFSERSLRAITTAKRIAQRFGATVHLAHVQEYSYPAVSFGPGAPVYAGAMIDFEELRKSSEERLTALAKEHRLTGTCRAEIGVAPFELISWMARKIGADLIVTSTHGRTGIKRAFLGSTAERLVQYSPCPVLVAREGKQAGAGRKPASDSVMSINAILVPVDFSACSLSGLNYAIGFAKKFSARIIVLHVVDLGPLLAADGYAVFNPAAFEQAALRDAEQGMNQFLQSANFGAVPFQPMVVLGGSVEAICKAASIEQADIIITATHGRTGLKHVLIGSTAEVVVRRAACPVLVVPSHPAVRAANVAEPKGNIQHANAKPPRDRQLAKPATVTRQVPQNLRRSVPERRLTNKFRESHRSATAQSK